MSQSTEDYLDSLLRHAMGIPDPEPEPVVEPEIEVLTEGAEDEAPATELESMLETDIEPPIEGTSFSSEKVSQFFEDDSPFSEDFVYPEEALSADGGIEIPEEMQMTDEGQKVLDESFGDLEATEVQVQEVPEMEELSAEEPQIEETAPAISIDDLDPNDANKAMDPDMIAALFASANAEETPIEEPIKEESAVEETIVEEPQMEELPAEEPQIEEATPSISIDDLDPNDANKAMDPDMIAALFASANAEETPIEEPITEESEVEETIVEEPQMEDLPAEEPFMVDLSAEEPQIEEATPSISIDDLDPNDANKAMDPDMIAALFASANAEETPIEETPMEETITEESAGEETIEEEPMMEELSAEEPQIEEAAPSISIDDLDPNDANKALDPDMIAALFASANAEETPIEEPITEESAVEETIEEEPMMEELSAEEPQIEEAAPSISIDDLDPNDANKALDPDMIAALFASANAEEAPTDETIAEERIQQDELTTADELDGDIDIENDSAPEATDLFPDEEISNLLDSLDKIDAEEEAKSNPDLELSGMDLGEVDLGAMLDDVNASLSDGVDIPEIASDDFNASDLNDLLNSIDGDSDISDIGNMLSKDENSELLDADTPTAESLFASDSDDVIFDFDNIIDEEEEEKSKKKKKDKKKKGKGLFGRKNKEESEGIEFELGDNITSDSNSEMDFIDPFGQDEEIAMDPDLLDIPEKNASKKEKKKGLIARIIDKLFEEVEDEEVSGKLIEESALDIAAEGAEVNEKILKEGSAESGKKKKKEKKKKEKPKKQKPKKEKKPKKPKKEKKPKPEKEPEPPTKKLPIKKVIPIFILCFSIGAFVIFFTYFYSYSEDMKNAKEYYAVGDYQKTYEYLSGHELKDDELVLYEKTFTLLKIQTHYKSYLNYMKMGFKMEALNALVQGLQAFDNFAQKAQDLGIYDRFSAEGSKIIDELMSTFGVSADEARQWYMLEGTEEYSRTLYDFINNSQPKDAEGNLIYVPDDGNNNVVSMEEEDL